MWVLDGKAADWHEVRADDGMVQGSWDAPRVTRLLLWDCGWHWLGDDKGRGDSSVGSRVAVLVEMWPS